MMRCHVTMWRCSYAPKLKSLGYSSVKPQQMMVYKRRDVCGSAYCINNNIAFQLIIAYRFYKLMSIRVTMQIRARRSRFAIRSGYANMVAERGHPPALAPQASAMSGICFRAWLHLRRMRPLRSRCNVNGRGLSLIT